MGWRPDQCRPCGGNQDPTAPCSRSRSGSIRCSAGAGRLPVRRPTRGCRSLRTGGHPGHRPGAPGGLPCAACGYLPSGFTGPHGFTGCCVRESGRPDRSTPNAGEDRPVCTRHPAPLRRIASAIRQDWPPTASSGEGGFPCGDPSVQAGVHSGSGRARVHSHAVHGPPREAPAGSWRRGAAGAVAATARPIHRHALSGLSLSPGRAMLGTGLAAPIRESSSLRQLAHRSGAERFQAPAYRSDAGIGRPSSRRRSARRGSLP